MTRNATPPATDQGPSSARPVDHVTRRGRASWLTGPPAGTARIEGESSAFGALPVTLPEGDPVHKETTPGELLAVSLAMFVAAALSEELLREGLHANELVVEAACTFSGALSDRQLSALELQVRGRVPGVDTAGFRAAAKTATRQALRAAGAREDLPCELRADLE